MTTTVEGKEEEIANMEKTSMINFCILDIWGVRFSAMMYDSLSKNRKKQKIQLYQSILKKADELIKEIINYAVSIQQFDQQNKAEFWSLIKQNHDYAIFRSCKNFVSFFPPEFMRKNSKFINKYGVFLPEPVLSGKPKK